MTTYMDVLRAHVVAAEARYLQGGRTLLDDPRAISDAIAEIERLRGMVAQLEAELSRNKAPYGYCPVCGQRGASRERRPNGNDRCECGHVYPSREAKAASNVVRGGAT